MNQDEQILNKYKEVFDNKLLPLLENKFKNEYKQLEKKASDKNEAYSNVFTKQGFITKF